MRDPRAIVPFILLVLCGCGEGLAEVKGTVTFNGEPIKKGTIRFEAVDQSTPTTGGDIVEGAYAVKVPRGEMKVSFTAVKITGEVPLYPDNPNSPRRPITINPLPDKYSEEKTEERLVVARGVNVRNWELTGP